MRIITICAALAMMGCNAVVVARTGRAAPAPEATPTPLPTEHAINSKGTGSNNGRMATSADPAIDTEGTGCTSHGRMDPADHAINTKGTGTRNGGAPAATDHAINTKGSGGVNGRAADPAAWCDAMPESGSPRP